MVSAPVVRDRKDEFCDERAELNAVLSSRSFQRAPKLSRILAYICERYFDGTASGLKEYSIAVDALGRSSGFDPQADAIVRVDLHLLRKRLDVYYAQEGGDHAIRIALPVGQYIPEFIPNDPPEPEIHNIALENPRLSPTLFRTAESDHPSLLDASRGPEEKSEEARETASNSTFRQGVFWSMYRTPLLAVLFGFVGVAIGAGGVFALNSRTVRALWMFADVPPSAQTATADVLRHFSSLGGAPDLENKAIRIRCGSNKDYVDSAGFRWNSDRYFAGGSEFRRDVNSIARSADPVLYSAGRQGVFHYDIPVSSGVYEVHLLFAETAPGVLDGMRQTSFIVGNGDSDTVDVVADAGGTNTATMKIYPNVRPGADGKIHINFWSTDGFLNALEIVPEAGGKPGPIRISALPTLYTDLGGRHWLPDRDFLGGRNVNHAFSLNRVDPPLFSRERYGNFNYAIPVAPNYSYQLTLYMAERYWGHQNSGLGGVGSRIFDVRCNEIVLLHNFDLLKETGDDASAVAVRFRNLRADHTGKVNLYFVPVTNYPLINALELEPE